MTSWCRFKELNHCIKDYENKNDLVGKKNMNSTHSFDKIEILV
jgi:hypothetical protein